jgi:hypothetical protein
MIRPSAPRPPASGTGSTLSDPVEMLCRAAVHVGDNRASPCPHCRACVAQMYIVSFRLRFVI